MKYILYINFFMILCISHTQAQTISSTGNWTVTIPDHYKVKEAGMDYANGISIESAANQTRINVYYTGWFLKWRVTVSSNNIPNGLNIYCKRTGDGNPSGLTKIYDGESYVPISSIESYFFKGKYYGLQDIPIQYKISNLSLTMPAGSHTIDITYTVIGGASGW